MANNIVKATTNQNYYFEKPEENKTAEKALGIIVSLEDIKQTHDNVGVVTFRNSHSLNVADKERLIICVEKHKKDNEEKVFVKTGLYAGRLTVNDVVFDIQPNYSEDFFKRMLLYANNIFVDKNEINSKKDRETTHDFPLFEYLFLISLQKSSILGFPQEYLKKEYHDIRVHGNLNVNSYIKNDIPYTGKLSSNKNERQYVQCIIDVLYSAFSMCNKNIKTSSINLNSFYTSELKAAASRIRPTLETIQKAKNHRSLQNPMFAPFRRTLDYAELILRKQNLISSDEKKSSNKISGYLLDIASLWELYLENLLRNHFQSEGWTISAQEELSLYEGTFVYRHNYPDLVMRNEDGRLVVFDAKFKKMNFVRDNYGNCDVDRTDLFQIQSYAGYYREKGENIILCGLIYPLSKQDQVQTQLYGLDDSKVKFIVDGIYVGNEDNPIQDKEISVQELAFINRLKKLLNP